MNDYNQGYLTAIVDLKKIMAGPMEPRPPEYAISDDKLFAYMEGHEDCFREIKCNIDDLEEILKKLT